LSGSGTGKTLNANGITLSAVLVYGIGCGWELTSALNIGTTNLTVNLGSLNTSGYTLTAAALLSSFVTPRTITLGASTVNLSVTTAISFPTSTNLIKELNSHNLLIVLDSAGGVGHMEFQITDELMKDKNYYLLLDDTHHLKHFRGLDIIKNRGDFTIINSSDKNGWVLAHHKA
jgi:hypothetical protein